MVMRFKGIFLAALMVWASGCMIGTRLYENEKQPLSETTVDTGNCVPLDGVYEFYGHGITHRLDDGRQINIPQRLSLNDALSRVDVWGNVEGVRINFAKERHVYVVEVLGKDLKSGAQISEMGLRYELSVNCIDGQWVHRLHMASASEGVSSIGNSIFYLSKQADGSLHIHEMFSMKSARLLTTSRRSGSTDSIFSPLGK